MYLLQIENSDAAIAGTALMVMIILGSLVAFVIMVYIVRYVFQIPELLKYHKAQTRLLMKIAKKLDVPKEDIDEATRWNK